jgi:hypothetical protein
MDKEGASRSDPKTLNMQVIELRDALVLIRECVKHLREGKWFYLPALAGQLRALLFDSHAQADCRLLQVAENFQVNLDVYCMPDVRSAEADALLAVFLFPVSAKKELPDQELLSVDQFRKRKMLRYKGIDYRVETLVEWFANKNGGAHYSKEVPLHFAELMSPGFRNLANLPIYFTQLGEVVLELGHRVLSKAVDQECHFLVGVNGLPKGNAYIADAKYDGAESRITLDIENTGRLRLRLQGMDGNRLQVSSSGMVDWTDIRRIFFSISISSNLNTRVAIYVDGKPAGSSETEFPMLAPSGLTNYEVLFNRQHLATENQDLELFLIDTKLYAREQGPEARARLLLQDIDAQQQDQTKGTLFTSGAFMRLTPGAAKVFEGAAQVITNAQFRQRLRDRAGQPEAGA